ncbi:MAG: hypothetical protein IKG85_02385 [Clostridia bacterium]|nr:hypothetical protein [Clostridia bacterium]
MKRIVSLLVALALALTPALGVMAEISTASVSLSHELASFDLGVTHAAAIQPTGLGYAWGFNYDGAVGNGITSSSDTLTPYNWGEGVRAVYANSKTTMFIDTNDNLYLIGEIWFGIGGSSDMPTPYVYTEPYLLASNVRSAAMGMNHIVFVKYDNTLWVYGENAHGQLGDNTTNNSYTPKQILTDVSYAAAGDCLTAAVKTDGTLWVWGFNSYGQVGNNSTTDCKTPVQVLTNVYTVSCMGDHVMAIKNDNTLWAWGSNTYGQLGRGNTTTTKTPVQVMTGAAQVSAGMFHTAVIKTDGTLWFCGNNWRGQFGSGTNSGYSEANSSFVQTAGTYLAVNCGYYATMVLGENGQILVAGQNNHGQLGTGSTAGSVPELTPIDVWIFNGDDDTGLLGDVNCDGVVDMADVSALSAYLLGKATLTEQGLINAEASGNGRVDASDISAVYQLIFSK